MSYQAQPQQLGYVPPAAVNTSGQSQGAAVPQEIQGWNWGAFWLSWIWGVGNSVTIALLALIVPFFSIYLGLKGSELAWQNKQWESVEHFQRVQKQWATWGLGLFVGSLALSCACVGLYFVVALAAVGSGA